MARWGGDEPRGGREAGGVQQKSYRALLKVLLHAAQALEEEYEETKMLRSEEATK